MPFGTAALFSQTVNFMKRTLIILSSVIALILAIYLIYLYQENEDNEEYERITRVVQMSSKNKSAIDARANGNIEEAIRLYTELIKQYPEQTWLYRQRGDMYNSIYEYSKALSDYYRVYFTRSSFSSPNQIPLKIGLIHMKLEQLDSAIIYFETILESNFESMEHFGYDTERWSANHQLGKIYFTKGEYSKSIMFFNKALEINRNTNTLYHRANTYFLLGEEELALNDYNESISDVRKYHIHKNPYLKDILCDTCSALFGTNVYLLATENWRTVEENIKHLKEIDGLTRNHPMSIKINKYTDSLIREGKFVDTTFEFNIYE